MRKLREEEKECKKREKEEAKEVYQKNKRERKIMLRIQNPRARSNKGLK